MRAYAIAFGVLATVAAAQAQVFDFNNAVNLTATPGSAWSYGRATSLSSAGFTANTSSVKLFGVWDGWGSSTTDGTARLSGFVGKNNGATTQFGVAAGQTVLHPGDPAQALDFSTFAVLRWTAPSAGTVSIIGSGSNASAFWGAGDSGAVNVQVNVAGTSRFAATSITANTNITGVTNVSILAGQTIDFVVGAGADPSGDSTPISGAINFQPVPEPGTIAALGLGAIALIRRRRNAKR